MSSLLDDQTSLSASCRKRPGFEKAKMTACAAKELKGTCFGSVSLEAASGQRRLGSGHSREALSFARSSLHQSHGPGWKKNSSTANDSNWSAPNG